MKVSTAVSQKEFRRAYKVPEDVQELDEVVEHWGLFLPPFRCTHEDIVAAEPARLMNVLECRVWRHRARGDEGRSTTAGCEFPLVRMPFIYIVAGMT